MDEGELNRRIGEWKHISACVPLLDKLVADFERLCDARKRLIAKQGETPAKGLAPELADDADVHKAVASIIEHGHALDAKFGDMPAFYSPRGHRKTPDTFYWLYCSPNFQHRLRSFVTTVTSRDLLDYEVQNEKNWLEILREGAKKSEEELRRIPEVQFAIFAELVHTREQASTRSVDVDATEPDDGSAANGDVPSQDRLPDANPQEAPEGASIDSGKRRRPCYDRDHQFLRWKKEGLTPAKIRDKWDSLREKERKGISPASYDCVGGPTIGEKKSGRAVVVQGLKKAQKEMSPPANNQNS
jgi:hypothetical protein